MVIAVIAGWCAGALAALPAVAWWSRDTARIPRRIWYWSGYDRHRWQRGVITGWLLGGIAAIAVIAAWARSEERRALLEETAEHRARHPHPHAF